MRAAGPARLALLAAAMLVALAPSARGATRHVAHRQGHRARAAAGVPYPADWGTPVYGASLPAVSGACVDPFDPDPIGGPDHVGDGGPGGFGPRCRAQAGVIPGTTLR